ncbi:N-acetylmuramoyl-L-alanine amidase, partial [Mesorhizobium sp. M2D.F.Ca.ET.145.01.1.1]
MGLADFTDKGCRVGGQSLHAFCLVLLVVFSSAFSTLANAADAPLVARGYKMAGDATKMRIVMDFDREPDV